MSVSVEYNELAYEWKPTGKRDTRFLSIVVGSLIFALLIGVLLESIQVPEEDRNANKVIPERIAEFILEKEKQKPIVIPEPKPEPKPKLEPIEKPKPRVKKKQETESQKPLTKEQKKAREKAQDSGLLALSGELADLIDTSEINTMVGGKVAKKSVPAKVASLDKSVLNKGVSEGSGGVRSESFGDATVASTQLSQQEILAVRQSLLAGDAVEQVAQNDSQESTANGSYRSEEEITLVFDQNKSKLYSIYNRERRRNPGLKGKIVLELTISPEGKVTAVNVVSSELNNPKLERSLLARIKLFKFSSDKSEPITVTYPIEFLPS